jgi:hypothetical protein
MFWIRFFAVAAIALAGCQTKPLYHGPDFQLAPTPATNAAKTPLVVEIIDQRPWWEHRYYEGNKAFVPLENVRPSPLAHLSDEIQRQARELPTPPQKVQLTLTSFRIVMCDSMADQRDNERDEEYSQRISDAESDDLLGTIAGVLIECGIRAAIQECRQGIEEWGQKERHLKGPPRHLDGKYPLGITCEMRATAKLQWSSGSCRDLDLRTFVNAGELVVGDSTYSDSEAVNAAVLASCAQMAILVKDKIKNPQTSASSDAKKSGPQFTAFGGN